MRCRRAAYRHHRTCCRQQRGRVPAARSQTGNQPAYELMICWALPYRNQTETLNAARPQLCAKITGRRLGEGELGEGDLGEESTLGANCRCDLTISTRTVFRRDATLGYKGFGLRIRYQHAISAGDDQTPEERILTIGEIGGVHRKAAPKPMRGPTGVPAQARYAQQRCREARTIPEARHNAARNSGQIEKLHSRKLRELQIRQQLSGRARRRQIELERLRYPLAASRNLAMTRPG